MRPVPFALAGLLSAALCAFAQTAPTQSHVASQVGHHLSVESPLEKAADIRPVQTQSHPSWWMYVSPEATAIVGIQWSYLRSSPLAEAIAAELSPSGSIPFPDWEFLSSSQQVLIASPSLMAIASGTFPAAVVRGSATVKGFKKTIYKDVEIWVAPQTQNAIASSMVTMSVARINEQIILFGHVATLKDAIDRGLQAGKKRDYSPLLAQGAKFAKQDLWVVANHLPDPLANLFVPLDVQARSFEGALSIWDGLHVVAALDAGSDEAADMTADRIWDALPSSEAFEDATEIATNGPTVQLKIDLDELQFQASLRKRESPAVVAVTTTPSPSVGASTEKKDTTKAPKTSANAQVPDAESALPTPPAVQPRLKAPEPPPPAAVPPPAPVVTAEAAKPAAPAIPATPKVEEAKPKVIHIYGLEGGTKNVPFPDAQ